MSPKKWWTWCAERPAEMSHLGSGFTLTPLLYSAALGKATRLPPGDGLSFGRRPIGDSTIALALNHGGTRLDWCYDISAPGAFTLDWQTRDFGEWGLRFWVLLAFQAGPEGRLRYDPARGALTGSNPQGTLTVTSAKAPLLVTFHQDLAALEREFADRGYFYLGSRGTKGAFAVLRFNLEEAPTLTVSAQLDGSDRPPASARPAAVAEGAPQQALDALYDVVAWNRTHDPINARPYTLLSRFWNSRKFGGFGVWLDDILYNALFWGHFDQERAGDDLAAVFAQQTGAGNLPCLVTGNDAWLDRSQPPIASYVVWSLAARSSDDALLARHYEGLLANHDWWWRERLLPEMGLLAYGTSSGPGEGLYKGTKLGAKNESSMDNSPVHDELAFDPQTGLLQGADVGLNSLYALDGEVLAMMARRLGQEDVAERLAARSRALKEAIAERLWDPDRRVFAGRHRDGRFVSSIAPTSFYPLAAGAARADQAEDMVALWLDNPRKFAGTYRLPSVTRDDPAYGDNVYWRGRVWGPLNYWTYQGLKRAGFANAAADLAEASWRLFAESWRDRLCGENYSAESGKIHDQPDSDGFYSWGALLPAIFIAEHSDWTPWSGWSLAAPPAGGRMGPVLSPLGQVVLASDAETWRLLRAPDSEVLLESNLKGRLEGLTLTEEGFSAILPAGPAGDWIALPHLKATKGLLGDQVISPEDGRWVLRERPAPTHLRVY